mgnify:CR=1 FL=1
MARPRKKDEPRIVTPPPATWAENNLAYLTGRALIDGVDELALRLEHKWGVDRLRLLVGDEMRERFDRQRVKFGRACREGALEDVQREAPRMRAAWVALDRAAEEAGEEPLSPIVWEVGLEDGSVARIVRTVEEAHAIAADGRQASVFCLDEIARLLDICADVIKAKQVFPGARVTATRRPEDPTFGMDVDWKFGDEVPF